jgi:hypothetical protein
MAVDAVSRLKLLEEKCLAEKLIGGPLRRAVTPSTQSIILCTGHLLRSILLFPKNQHPIFIFHLSLYSVYNSMSLPHMNRP